MASIRKITIYEQGDLDTKKELAVPANATVESIMKQAANALNVTLPKQGAKMFFQNGSPVDEVELIRKGDVISLSLYPGRQVLHSIAVMGPGAVGKSAITLYYVQEQFVIDYDPTIEDAYRKNDNIAGSPCILDILDTAGQDEYNALRSTWMQERNGFLLVYSVASKTSFMEIEDFYDQLMVVSEGNIPPLVLVANKVDIPDRKVSQAEGMALAKKWRASYIETSAKEGKNIKEAFYLLVQRMRERELKRMRAQDDGKSNRSARRKSNWFCSLV